MLDAAAGEMEMLAGVVADHRRRVAPLMDQVLNAVGGSSQRVDRDMVELLRATRASLDVAIAALHTAARETRSASFAQTTDGYGNVGG